MKNALEKLLNHLGLAADATEEMVLTALATLPTLAAFTELKNSVTALQTKHDGLVTALQASQAELVNRDLADFEAVITPASKAFWSAQLLANRAGTVATLTELATALAAEGEAPAAPTARKPLHNRAAARPVIPPVGGGAAGAGTADAAKIRNRAHEIAKSEGIAFSTAFRRAEKEAGV